MLLAVCLLHGQALQIRGELGLADALKYHRSTQRWHGQGRLPRSIERTDLLCGTFQMPSMGLSDSESDMHAASIICWYHLFIHQRYYARHGAFNKVLPVSYCLRGLLRAAARRLREPACKIMSGNGLEVQAPRRMRTTAEEIEAKEQELKKQEKEGHRTHTTWGTICLAWSSLGVIYGDIGTSPLYCFATTFSTLDVPDQGDVMGVASLIFWIMTLVVLVKYVLIVLRADDNGEGGTFALYSMLMRSIGLTPFGAGVDKSDVELNRYSLITASRVDMQRRTLGTVTGWMAGRKVNRAVRHAFRHSWGLQMALLLTVVSATAMVVGDGILTPSISVMGAVQGLTVATDTVTPEALTGISVAVLVLLFIGQRYGSGLVGQAFAPVVVIWLAMNAILGIYNLSTYGCEIFRSLSPWWIVHFFMNNGHDGWQMLGGVILCITGAEAMYSDLGHFNRKAVSLGFISFVYPCLMLTYWGQGAFLLEHPEQAEETFWKSVPDTLFWPFFVMAILASVVASQALISGSFSIMRQASALGLFPKMSVHHTGRKIEGQIYMPGVNYTLMVLCVAVTVGFQSTHQLGEAYGVAVMTVMTLTSLLVCLVMLMAWNLHPLLVALFFVVYLPLEGMFLSATLVKVPTGGWVALVAAFILGSLKMTWWWGTMKKHQHVVKHKSHIHDMLMEVDPLNSNKPSMPRSTALCNNLAPFKLPRRQVVLVATGEPVARMPGLGIYYSESSGGVPAVMQHVLATMPTLYTSMVFMTVRSVALPTVDKAERFLLRRDKTISSCYHATVRYGYLDRVDHSQVFMEQLVLELLQHLLDRKGVGSPGAAKRLLITIANKARVSASDSGTADKPTAAAGLPQSKEVRVSSGAAVSGAESVAQTLALAAEAAQIASASYSSSLPASSTGIVSEILSRLTAAELLAVLQPVGSLSARDFSHKQLFQGSKSGSTSGAVFGARGQGGSADGLACITVRMTGGSTPESTTGPLAASQTGSKHVGFQGLTQKQVGDQPGRAPARLTVDGAVVDEVAGQTADSPDSESIRGVPAVAAGLESTARPQNRSARATAGPAADEASALCRMPSYWIDLPDGKESELQSDSEEDSEHVVEEEEQQQCQQPVKPLASPVSAAVSDLISPVSVANSSSIGSADNTSTRVTPQEPGSGERIPNPSKDGSSADDDQAVEVPQLSNAQATALQQSARLLEDYHRRWVHCVGRTTLKVLPRGSLAQKVVLGGLYKFMATNSRQVTDAWNIPTLNLIELGMDVEV